MCFLSPRGFSANAVALPHSLARQCPQFVCQPARDRAGIRDSSRVPPIGAAVALFIKASKSRRGIFRIFAQPTLCVARIAFGIHWKAAKCQPASAASAANPPRRRAAMCVGERGLFVQLITRAAQLTARLWVGSRNKTRRSKITAGSSSRLFRSRAIIPASNPRDCFSVTDFSPSIA